MGFGSGLSLFHIGRDMRFYELSMRVLFGLQGFESRVEGLGFKVKPKTANAKPCTADPTNSTSS